MKNKKYALGALSLAIIAATAFAGQALAAENGSTTKPEARRPGLMRGIGNLVRGEKPGLNGIFGTITAINGTTLTVSGRQGRAMMGNNSTSTLVSYTVDASKAKIVIKNNATGTISGLTVGNAVMIAGTVSGTSVTANLIREGQLGGPRIKLGDKEKIFGHKEGKASSTLATTSDRRVAPRVGMFRQFFGRIFGF